MNRTDLSKFSNAWYHPGGGSVKRVLWYVANSVFLNSSFPLNSFKIFILKLFGAKIGKGVVIKPHVNIKYPWFLSLGNHVWIGEHVFIDNLATITIGNNVCLSQRAMLLTGNHDYKKRGFDLSVKKINIEDGVWIGAGAVVCPGVTCKDHSVLMVGSIATKDLEPYSVYRGNPAEKVKDRLFYQE